MKEAAGMKHSPDPAPNRSLPRRSESREAESPHNMLEAEHIRVPHTMSGLALYLSQIAPDGICNIM
jgi:hypothetical protein